MSHKRSDVGNFLIAIIIFIVALVLLLVFMIFYFKGGINLFHSINEVNGTNVVNDINNNYYP
ncbi:MAG: hypothetical protein ACP5GJ_00695 [Nanopusillaceae archaeon]|jgi:uncharacterized membrane protein